MRYFYALYSLKDENFYYGSTSNLKQRVRLHNDEQVLSTKHRRPLLLAYYEAYLTIDKAREREKQVKLSGSIRKQLFARISSNLPVCNPTSDEGQPGLRVEGRASSSAG